MNSSNPLSRPSACDSYTICAGAFLMLDTTGHFAHTIAMLTAPPAGVERGSDSKG